MPFEGVFATDFDSETVPEIVGPWIAPDLEGSHSSIELAMGENAATYCISQYSSSVSVGNAYAHADGPEGRNDLISLFGVETASFEYDGNKNLATKTQAGATWTYAYNEMGLLKEVNKDDVVRATYAYEAFSRRVKAIENVNGSNVTTLFVYGLGLDPLGTKSGSGETRYVYANGLRIARTVVDASTCYHHLDALGSTWRMMMLRRTPPSREDPRDLQSVVEEEGMVARIVARAAHLHDAKLPLHPELPLSREPQVKDPVREVFLLVLCKGGRPPRGA